MKNYSRNIRKFKLANPLFEMFNTYSDEAVHRNKQTKK